MIRGQLQQNVSELLLKQVNASLVCQRNRPGRRKTEYQEEGCSEFFLHENFPGRFLTVSFEDGKSCESCFFCFFLIVCEPRLESDNSYIG